MHYIILHTNWLHINRSIEDVQQSRMPLERLNERGWVFFQANAFPFSKSLLKCRYSKLPVNGMCINWVNIQMEMKFKPVRNTTGTWINRAKGKIINWKSTFSNKYRQTGRIAISSKYNHIYTHYFHAWRQSGRANSSATPILKTQSEIKTWRAFMLLMVVFSLEIGILSLFGIPFTLAIYSVVSMLQAHTSTHPG